MAKNTDLIVLDGNLKGTHLVQKSEPLLLMRTVPFELGELKILDTYLSRINSRNENCRVVTFTKSEYEQLMGIGKINISTLKKYTKKMLGKVVEVPTEKGYVQFTLFTCAKCDLNEYGERIIELSCSEEAKQLFFGIEQRGYLQYELKNILSLTSKYSFLLYLYLRRERYRSDWVISLDDLREQRLDIKNNETYSNFKYFKRDILDKSVAEINKKTDCNFEYKTIKRGRKVVEIEFIYHSSETEEIDENQLTFEDISSIEQKTYDADDTLGLLSDAVNNEFTQAQMDEIFQIICLLPLEHTNGIDIARYHFLAQMYAKLNTAAERAVTKGKPIRDRYKYFLTLLRKEQESKK